jgi:transposase
VRFSRWAKTGVWARVFEHLARDADNEYAMIDATIVRAHQHSAGAQKKKTAMTKRSATARRIEHENPRYRRRAALDNPTGFHLTPGQAHDLEGADALLPGLEADALLADKAYDADERIIEPLRHAEIEPVIPQRPTAKSRALTTKTSIKLAA